MSKSANKRSKRNASKESSSSEEEYEVETILDHRIDPKTKSKEYLVKWKNYSTDEATWEPHEHLDNVKDIVQRYERKSKKTHTKGTDSNNAPSSKDEKKKGPSSGKKEEPKKTVKPSEIPKRRSMIQRKKEVEPEEQEDQMSEEAQEQQDDDVQQISRSEASDDEKSGAAANGEEEEELVFVAVLDKRDTSEGVTEYLIHFQDIENQWVEESQLEQIKDEVKAFNERREAEMAAVSEQESKKKESQKLKPTIVAKKSTAKRSAPSEPVVISEKNSKSDKQLNEKPSKNSVKKIQVDLSINEVSNSKKREEEVMVVVKESTKEIIQVEQGDFKTDNVDRIELLGELKDLVSSRFQVFWKSRKDGVVPAPQFYSSSYIRRQEPSVLIDYLINLNLENNNAQVFPSANKKGGR